MYIKKFRMIPEWKEKRKKLKIWFSTTRLIFNTIGTNSTSRIHMQGVDPVYSYQLLEKRLRDRMGQQGIQASHWFQRAWFCPNFDLWLQDNSLTPKSLWGIISNLVSGLLSWHSLVWNPNELSSKSVRDVLERTMGMIPEHTLMPV